MSGRLPTFSIPTKTLALMYRLPEAPKGCGGGTPQQEELGRQKHRRPRDHARETTGQRDPVRATRDLRRHPGYQERRSISMSPNERAVCQCIPAVCPPGIAPPTPAVEPRSSECSTFAAPSAHLGRVYSDPAYAGDTLIPLLRGGCDVHPTSNEVSR